MMRTTWMHLPHSCPAGIPEFLVLAGNQNFTLMPLSVMPKEGYPASSAKIVCDTLLQRMDTAPPIRYDAIANLDEFKWSQCFGSAGEHCDQAHTYSISLLLLLVHTIAVWVHTGVVGRPPILIQGSEQTSTQYCVYKGICLWWGGGDVVSEGSPSWNHSSRILCHRVSPTCPPLTLQA